MTRRIDEEFFMILDGFIKSMGLECLIEINKGHRRRAEAKILSCRINNLELNPGTEDSRKAMRDGIMAEGGSEYSASSSERAVRYEILHVSCGAPRKRLDRHTAWGRLRI